MKKITLLLTTGLLSLSFALSVNDVEAKIQNIQKLPPKERVAQMNALKEQIASMKPTDREKVMAILTKTHETMTTTMQQTKEKMHTKANDMQHQMDTDHDNMDHEKPEMPDVEHMPSAEKHSF